MQKIVYLQFFSIFFLDFLNKYGLLARQFTWIPDIIAAVLFVVVIILLVTRRVVNIHASYIIIFSILFLHILFSIILNEVPTGAIFQAIRNYFKYIPFFLLPIAYKFSNEEIENQLKLLGIMAVLQFPIALYQRFVEAAGSASGDAIRGTFGTSSLLSIFLICSFSLCIAFYIKKRMTSRTLFALCILLLIPTTINETKGTLFLLPFGLLIPALITGTVSEKIKRVLTASALGIVLMVAFITIYDQFLDTSKKADTGLIDFLTRENRLEGYLAPHASGLRTNLPPGRIDVILNPFKELYHDPVTLTFGLGPGNVSRSFLGSRFSGNYVEQYGEQMYLAMSTLLWEFGILGTLLTLILWYLIYRDSRKVATNNDISGSLAVGWAGIIGVLTLSLLYKNIITSDTISFLFWYFSGYIAAKATEIERSRRFQLASRRKTLGL